MRFSGQINPDQTIGYFRIASTTGRRPIEPFTVGQFLIGSGPECQLRFGDDTIADVHAQVDVTPESAVLTVLSHTVPVLVNGEAVQECRLHDGDLLELLDHRILFRLTGAASRITLDEDSFLSAPVTLEGVVDRLQEQIELLEDLAHTPEKGISDLLKAVAESNAQQPVAAPEPESELKQILTLLHKQHEASRIRLESLTEVLNNVVRQQKMIADTLEVMSGRIQSLDSSTYPPRRASA
ncbi:MAG: FHA domain-containing protein [Planctomycetaceae bacterium]|nr:FHA domain-containing protein [Planctomycetaceae bacterium]